MRQPPRAPGERRPAPAARRRRPRSAAAPRARRTAAPAPPATRITSDAISAIAAGTAMATASTTLRTSPRASARPSSTSSRSRACETRDEHRRRRWESGKREADAHVAIEHLTNQKQAHCHSSWTRGETARTSRNRGKESRDRARESACTRWQRGSESTPSCDCKIPSTSNIGRGDEHQSMPREQPRRDDDVGDAGLVLEAEEHEALRRARPLAHDHAAGHAHRGAVAPPDADRPRARTPARASAARRSAIGCGPSVTPGARIVGGEPLVRVHLRAAGRPASTAGGATASANSGPGDGTAAAHRSPRRVPPSAASAPMAASVCASSRVQPRPRHEVGHRVERPRLPRRHERAARRSRAAP